MWRVTMNYLLVLLWEICILVQAYLGFGSAYRLTKKGGDDGVALFGWMAAMSFIALIPGLGIYLLV